MSLIRLSPVLMLFSVLAVYSAEGLSRTELIHGVNQARLSIENGEVEYLFLLNYAAEKSEEEIVAWMQTEKQKELEAFTPDPSLPDIGLKEFEKHYLLPYLNYWGPRYGEHTAIEKASIAFEILETNKSYPKVYQYKLRIQEQPGITLEHQASRFPQPGRFYCLTYDTHLQVKEDIGDIIFSTPSVHTSNSDDYDGFRHLWALGRSVYHVPTSAKLIGKEQIDGVECYVLGFQGEDSKHVTIWVDPDKTFCIRRSEVRSHSDAPAVEYLGVFKKFQRFGDIWYPTVVEKYPKKGGVLKSYGFKILAAAFNVRFPKDFFSIDGGSYHGQHPHTNDTDPLGIGTSEIRQRNDREKSLLLCGPESLLRICEILKTKTSLRELKKLSNFHPDRGTTMLDLKQAATYKGLGPTGVRVPLKLLKKNEVPLPAIAYVEGNHFFVFESVNTKGIDITDSTQKYDTPLSWEKLREIWQGELLIFDKKRAGAQKQEPMPLALIEAPEYHFGKALGGSEINHTFTIENIGQKPLKILSVTETCACTVSILSQNEILPGKVGNISVVLTVPSDNTPVQESLLVLTNDPTQRTLPLTLKGQAFLPLVTFPERLTFGNQRPLQKPLIKKMSLHIEKDVQIRRVSTDSAHLKATLVQVGNIPHIEVMLLPSSPIGQFSFKVLIDYEYQQQPTTHDVLVFGKISGELHVTPKRLFFGMVEEASETSKKITISSLDAQPFQITAIESGSKAITVKIAEQENDSRYDLIIIISDKSEPGEFSGEIVVHTSNATQPILHIPFFGILINK